MMKKIFLAGAVLVAGTAAAELVRKDREIKELKKRVDRLEEKSDWFDLDEEFSDDDDDAWFDEAEERVEKENQEDNLKFRDDDFTFTDGDLKNIDKMMSENEAEKDIPINTPEDSELPPGNIPEDDFPESLKELSEGLPVKTSVKNTPRCPDKKTLRRDFKNAGSQKKLAEKYGVDPNTIRRWLDKRGLPRRVEELN